MKMFQRFFTVMQLGTGLFVLTACSVLEGAQQYAGLVKWEANFDVVRNGDGSVILNAAGDPVIYPVRIYYISGQEARQDDIIVELSEGSILNFNKSEVKAFEGQALRAKVHEIAVSKGIDLTSDVVAAIADGILGMPN